MRISPIISFNVYSANKSLMGQIKSNLPYDTVSFSAKRKKTDNKPISPNIIKSTQFGEKLYSELKSGATKKDISKRVKEELPTLQVQSLSGIEKQVVFPDGYAAYFTSPLDDDFSMTKSTMYLSEEPFRIADNIEKLSFALDVAHEYTHAQQVISGRESEFYKEISDCDVDMARTIVGMSNLTYELMDKSLQARTLSRIFANPIDFFNFQKYGKEIPREIALTKQMLISNANCTNEAQYKSMVQNECKMAFIRAIEYVIQHPENVEESIFKTLMKIGNEDKIDDLFEKTKLMCAHNAEGEAEARTTESIIAKKVLGVRKTLNIDCYPMYYELVSNALK
ncbi:hypothetical protein IJD44_08555 [bacterium]|nr:hypothetical protein [bacterium]